MRPLELLIWNSPVVCLGNCWRLYNNSFIIHLTFKNNWYGQPQFSGWLIRATLSVQRMVLIAGPMLGPIDHKLSPPGLSLCCYTNLDCCCLLLTLCCCCCCCTSNNCLLCCSRVLSCCCLACDGHILYQISVSWNWKSYSLSSWPVLLLVHQ